MPAGLVEPQPASLELSAVSWHTRLRTAAPSVEVLIIQCLPLCFFCGIGKDDLTFSGLVSRSQEGPVVFPNKGSRPGKMA